MHHLPSRYIPCDGRLTASAYFNPRSPQGSDNRPPYYALYYIIFQPTRPAWGATKVMGAGDATFKFQSTLPAWGATVQSKHTAMTA